MLNKSNALEHNYMEIFLIILMHHTYLELYIVTEVYEWWRLRIISMENTLY